MKTKFATILCIILLMLVGCNNNAPNIDEKNKQVESTLNWSNDSSSIEADTEQSIHEKTQLDEGLETDNPQNNVLDSRSVFKSGGGYWTSGYLDTAIHPVLQNWAGVSPYKLDTRISEGFGFTIEGQFCSSFVVGMNEEYYFNCYDNIKAYTKEGNLSWVYESDIPNMSFQDIAIGENGNIYIKKIHKDSPEILCIDSTYGVKLWGMKGNNYILFDYTNMYVTDGKLNLVTTMTGDIVQTYDINTDSKINITNKGEVIVIERGYVQDDSINIGGIRVLNTATQTVSKLYTGVTSSNFTIDSNNTLYYMSGNTQPVLTASTIEGNIKWQYTLSYGTQNSNDQISISDDNIIYMIADRGNNAELLALSEEGILLWSKKTKYRASNLSRPIIDNSNNIILAYKGGDSFAPGIFVYDKDGELLTELYFSELPYIKIHSPLVISPDGSAKVVIYKRDDGRLLSISAPDKSTGIESIQRENSQNDQLFKGKWSTIGTDELGLTIEYINDEIIYMEFNYSEGMLYEQEFTYSSDEDSITLYDNEEKVIWIYLHDENEISYNESNGYSVILRQIDLN